LGGDAKSAAHGPHLDVRDRPRSTLSRRCTVSSADVRPLSKQTSNDPLYRRVQAEVRLLDYSQTTLPKKIRTMSAGPQSPVLTFTKVPATSAQPAI
jgi:hypothetical protein